MLSRLFTRDAALRVGLLAAPLIAFVAALRIAGWWPPRGLDGASGIAIAAGDAAVLALGALGAMLVVGRLRGLALGAATGLLYVLTVGVGILAVLQYGYAFSFGLPLDLLVMTTHSNAAGVESLWPVVRAEFDALRIALALFPFALVAGHALAMRSGWARRWASGGGRDSGGADTNLGQASSAVPVPAALAGGLASAGALALVAVLASGSGEYGRYLWQPPPHPWGAPPGAVRPLFDARDARAVRTDSTRALNVVVVIMESVRADATGPWGGPAPTPTLDALAARGLVVDEMLSVTPYTNKTLGALFSGTVPNPASELTEATPGGLPSVGLPDLLAPHGYASAFVTPALLAYERKDIILDNLGFGTQIGSEVLEASGAERLDRRALGVDDGDIVPPALAWAEAHVRAGRPFVLGVLTLSGHYPYAVPPEAPKLDLSEGSRERAYLDAVAHSDRSVGALLEGLDGLGALDSTVVVVVGDHGQAFGEHGLFAHGDGLYQEALHVPGLVAAPGLAPRRVRGPRQHTDLVPTVLDVLGLRLENARLPGRSLRLPPLAGRELVFTSHHDHMATAWRLGDVKALCRLTCAEMEVYDLAADPGETRDLAGTWPQARRDSVGRAMAAWRAAARAAYERE